MAAFDPVHDALASNDTPTQSATEQQKSPQQQQPQPSQPPQQLPSLQTLPLHQIPDTPSRPAMPSIFTNNPPTFIPKETLPSIPSMIIPHQQTTPSVPLAPISMLGLRTNQEDEAQNHPQHQPQAQQQEQQQEQQQAQPQAQPQPIVESATDTTINSEIASSTPNSPTDQRNSAQSKVQNVAEMGDHVTITTPGKPTIIKHKLNPHYKTGEGRRRQKRGPYAKVPVGGVTITPRAKHLKKEDGEPFWRKDIQYEFLRYLFDDNIKAFTDPYPESKENVSIDSRKPSDDGKLSFAEVYIKTIAQSSKCSKVLRDRLLNDMKTSIPTCMICLLVNVGRMNTTINFVPDMRSQLRTYHPIPSLQLNYDAGPNMDRAEKQLQDTPRLKSILKACCDDPAEPNGLHSLALSTKIPKTNVINMIFILCNIEEAINRKFFQDVDYNFFDLIINSNYPPMDRAQFFLWILYNYLETQLDDESISKNPYGAKPVLTVINPDDYDVDTPGEREFGKELFEQRHRYLAAEDSTPVKKSKPNEDISEHNGESSSEHLDSVTENEDHKDGTESIDENSSAQGTEHLVKGSKSSKAAKSQGLATPQKNNSSMKPPRAAAPSSATGTLIPPPAVQLTYRQDIDVDRIRKHLVCLKKRKHRIRMKNGLLTHEYKVIKRESSQEEKEFRPKLLTYKGDYGECASKFKTLFNLLKSDYAELSKAVMLKEKAQASCEYEDENESLKLKSFSINITG